MTPNKIVRSVLAGLLAATGLLAHSAPAAAQHGTGSMAAAKVTFPAGKDVVEIPFELDRDKIVLRMSQKQSGEGPPAIRLVSLPAAKAE